MKDSIEWMTIGIDPFRILITAAQVLTNLINIIIKEKKTEDNKK